jgi:2-oxo-4-hydroxy-4-carboxy-5-ureidoimidazoline decarboxylase
MTGLAEFDAAPAAGAGALLQPCCASAAWQDELVAGRPYGTVAALTARSDELLALLDWAEIEAALAAHPRIGERADGTDTESTWSREEQSAAGRADADLQAALRTGNRQYEDRFGHVFLICATGRSAQEMLAALTERLAHDAITEREVVRRELAAIVRLRLAKAVAA